MSFRIAALLVFLTLLSTSTMAAESHFRGVTCKSDVAKQLLGRQVLNDRPAAIEAMHRDLSLESLGSVGVEAAGDPWTMSTWLICGREYLFLEKKGVIKDILASPYPAGEPQSEVSPCVIDGRPEPSSLVWFSLDQSKEKSKLANQAWAIDDKKVKFIKLQAKSIQCESTR